MKLGDLNYEINDSSKSVMSNPRAACGPV